MQRIRTARDGRKFVERDDWPCECEAPGTRNGCTKSGWIRCNARLRARNEAQRSIGRNLFGYPLPDEESAS